MRALHRLSGREAKQLAALPIGPARNRLREAFRLARCQQQDAVQATGISAANLSRIVNGRRYRAVRIDTAQALAAFFGVPVDLLFPRSKGKPDGAAA